MLEWIKHEGLKVVVIFEGRDAAGKGGVIKRITQHLSPRICRVIALPAPTEREQTQWYFQRYVPHLPAAGEMVLFDRSWYNRAGVERVMGFCTDEEHREFLRTCPEFERMLVRSGIKLIKYWFSVSDEEQEKRFQSRLEQSHKRWKLSPMDLESRRRWAAYSKAKDEMFAHTDIKQAPWYVVESDVKKHARLNCISHLLSMIAYEDLTPEPIELPQRTDAGAYVRPPYSDQTLVPPALPGRVGGRTRLVARAGSVRAQVRKPAKMSRRSGPKNALRPPPDSAEDRPGAAVAGARKPQSASSTSSTGGGQSRWSIHAAMASRGSVPVRNGMALIALAWNSHSPGCRLTPRLAVPLPFRDPGDDVIYLRCLVTVQRIEDAGRLQRERHQDVRVREGRLIAVARGRARHREHGRRVAHGQLVRPVLGPVRRDPSQVRRRRGQGAREHPLARRGGGLHGGVEVARDHRHMRGLDLVSAPGERLPHQIVENGRFRALRGGGLNGVSDCGAGGRQQQVDR